MNTQGNDYHAGPPDHLYKVNRYRLCTGAPPCNARYGRLRIKPPVVPVVVLETSYVSAVRLFVISFWTGFAHQSVKSKDDTHS